VLVFIRLLPGLTLGELKKKNFLAPSTYAIMLGARNEMKAWQANRGGIFPVPCQTWLDSIF
jgi:hypothetical protein